MKHVALVLEVGINNHPFDVADSGKTIIGFVRNQEVVRGLFQRQTVIPEPTALRAMRGY